MLKKIKVKNGVGIIPEGTIELMYHTFEDASKLVSVVIPNTVRCIGFGAFEGCSSLTSISIPSSVNTIQGRAFEGCSSLTSISIPSSVKTIQQGAFKGCSSLATIVVEEGNIKSKKFTAAELLAMDCNFDQCKFPKDDEEVLPPAELLAEYFKKRKALDHEIDKALAEIQNILGIEIKIED